MDLGLQLEAPGVLRTLARRSDQIALQSLSAERRLCSEGPTRQGVFVHSDPFFFRSCLLDGLDKPQRRNDISP